MYVKRRGEERAVERGCVDCACVSSRDTTSRVSLGPPPASSLAGVGCCAFAREFTLSWSILLQPACFITNYHVSMRTLPHNNIN